MGAINGSSIDGSGTSSHADGMSRRQLLRLAAGSAFLSAFGRRSAWATTLSSAPHLAPARVRAICFDVFTLFDPRSVVRVAEAIVGEHAAALCELWRVRQFEYSWLRASARRYVDFEVITRDALAFAARSRGITLQRSDAERLVGACSELEPWPDTRDWLDAWKRQGLRLAPLSNYSPRMLARLMEHANLTAHFDALISADVARTFKPDPRAYSLGEGRLGLRREEIVFAAFGGWDAAGASWFGFKAFWVNRLSVTGEELVSGPIASGTTFADLAAFVATRTGSVVRGPAAESRAGKLR